MKRILAIVLGFWIAATAVWAQDAGAIEGVIGNQLEAFNDRDIEEAWQYASPNIKRLFGNPGNFGMMVQQGYPMVWDNADVRFLELRDVAGNLWQKVMVRDAQGGLHILDYQMIETAEGWQINGVQLLPSPDVGA
ncbi:MAG: DUF4864 domain-containing protein [Yoonia sp.]|uniref:DUF4864 domain-containing protein n=1 Tax=Yoonia sp. TaxID=2212373 RepID=UPI00273EAA01|nr:DUF4864 domain-containing protein [Yoonia sp.]MDP5085981.1 DUF4864 domain-containing protein [Yoonia sp.]MDP5360202.1 DUF4864 domain-containing protein [Paracoccaceae bacterium]